MQVAREAPCLMDVILHQDLHLPWKRWTKSVICGRTTMFGTHFGSGSCMNHGSDQTVAETAQDCRALLESIFNDTCATPRVRDMYVECAQGEVADIAECHWEQQDKTKKKKVEEGNNKDEQSAPKVVVTE
ncbi:hypothetical protein NPIL_121471 [Nephila pilipes]|uniref:Uncharacterized protein n=1 Tax=Nephila pilipes TaxID=299642 RepID=A0A8X6NYW2_NEPPI|nr:hypothetical protein NPIL_121471 [Nephila pilipes]